MAVGLVLLVAGGGAFSALAKPPVPVVIDVAVLPSKVDSFRIVNAIDGKAVDLYRLKDAFAVVTMHGPEIAKSGLELEQLKSRYGGNGAREVCLGAFHAEPDEESAQELRAELMQLEADLDAVMSGLVTLKLADNEKLLLRRRAEKLRSILRSKDWLGFN